VTPDGHGSAVIEFPNELEILITREFDAPIQLVFDVFTKTEHVRKTFAPFGEEVTECSIDLRVGGDYHYVMVTDDGTGCVQPPLHHLFRNSETERCCYRLGFGHHGVA